MVFEHFALNVKDVAAVATWYVKHLELQVVRQQQELPYMTFLADSTGRVIIELYQKQEIDTNNFTSRHQATFHVAFISENAKEDSERLHNAGASFVEKVLTDDGTILIMLRDPWGMPLQLCQRKIKL